MYKLKNLNDEKWSIRICDLNIWFKKYIEKQTQNCCSLCNFVGNFWCFSTTWINKLYIIENNEIKLHFLKKYLENYF